MGYHDLLPCGHALGQVCRRDGGGGRGDGLQMGAVGLDLAIDFVLHRQLFRDALKNDLYVCQVLVGLREGQLPLTGGRLPLGHQALAHQVPVIGAVFLQAHLRVFG